jgi:cation diffusion facilitator family transporter
MNFLYRKFIKNYKNIRDPKVAEKYGLLASIVGIILNVLLFLIKFLLSIISGSVSIISDAFNNLSDASSSIVTLIGFKMSSKPADEKHPFGYQRIEYICAFIISVIILYIGVELGISSVKKVANPKPVEFSYLMLIILTITVLIKMWMGIFYKKTGQKINSLSLKATAKDSFNDVVATIVIIIGLLIGFFFDINLDGFLGTFVSIYIVISGISIIKETINQLIGGTPDKELIDKVLIEVSKEEQILGVHDVLYHGYGLGHIYISLHAEMDSTLSLVKAHELIDFLEKTVKKIYNVDLIIHIDPVSLNDELLSKINNKLKIIVKNISDKLSHHELKVVNKKKRTHICFALQVPYSFEMSNKEIYDNINKELRLIDDNYRASITFEKK